MRPGNGTALGGAAVAVALATAFGASDAGAAEKLRWKVPVAFGTNLPALGDNIVYVADTLKAASGGNVQMKVFEPGKLVPPFSITDAVKDKKVPAGYTWVGYDQGKIPSAPLLAASCGRVTGGSKFPYGMVDDLAPKGVVGAF